MSVIRASVIRESVIRVSVIRVSVIRVSVIAVSTPREVRTSTEVRSRHQKMGVQMAPAGGVGREWGCHGAPSRHFLHVN